MNHISLQMQRTLSGRSQRDGAEGELERFAWWEGFHMLVREDGQ